MFASIVVVVVFAAVVGAQAQEAIGQQDAKPAETAAAVPEAPKLTADERATFDMAKVQQVQAEAAVMTTRAYKEFAKAQEDLLKAQRVAQEKQKAMLAALQATPEYRSMAVLRSMLEARLKARGEKHVVDWATGDLKTAPPAQVRR